jgi:superfamily II DNA/RNA helicase
MLLRHPLNERSVGGDYIIVAPTKELAAQINDVATTLFAGMKLNAVAAIGGVTLPEVQRCVVISCFIGG